MSWLLEITLQWACRYNSAYATFCSSFHQLMDIWVASTSWLIKNAAMNIGVQISAQVPASTYFVSILPEVKLLDHMVILCLIFWGTPHGFPQRWKTFFTFLHCTGVPVSPHSHQHLLFSFFFKIIAILMGVKWYLNMNLICTSLMIMMLSIFSRACWHLKVCLFAYFWIGFFLLSLSSRSFLYILDVNPLLDICFASIFFHSVDCLFNLLLVSYCLWRM